MTLALIVLVVFGGLLAANVLIDNRTLSPSQLQAVTAVCTGCHGRVPSYQAASTVHSRHSAFTCSHCHRDNNGLKSADTLRLRLGWVGAALVGTALAGAAASLWVINAKSKAK